LRLSLKESRMKLLNASNLDRKSGPVGSGGDFAFAANDAVMLPDA
jgi:ATP-dependent protease HslVU (ClpYQ) peptidase subunit